MDFNLDKAKELGLKTPKKPMEEYDEEQLTLGMEIEKEHIEDPDITAIIAAHHLDEMPDYYTRLKEMEEEAQQESEETENEEEIEETAEYTCPGPGMGPGRGLGPGGGPGPGKGPGRGPALDKALGLRGRGRGMGRGRGIDRGRTITIKDLEDATRKAHELLPLPEEIINEIPEIP